MPAGVTEIPRRWLTLPHRVHLAPIGRMAGLVAASGLLVAVVAQLPRLLANLPIGTSVTVEAAAAHLGIPEGQIVMTEDGALALRLVDGEPLAAELLLVTSTASGPETHVLTEVAVPLGVLDPDSGLVWSEQLSCAPERGLRRPNVLFGAAPTSQGLTVTVPARIAKDGRLFIVVFEAADLRGVDVGLAVGSRPFDRRPGMLFERRDACNGEAPRGH